MPKLSDELCTEVWNDGMFDKSTIHINLDASKGKGNIPFTSIDITINNTIYRFSKEDIENILLHAVELCECHRVDAHVFNSRRIIKM